MLRQIRSALVASILALAGLGREAHANSVHYPTKSGIRQWVDPATPKDRFTYTTSRGRQWDLVMSDEFDMPGRSFLPGDDHMWTSIEKPDGVNQALEFYSSNMTSTECDDDGNCYLYINVIEEETHLSIYNAFLHPPGMEDIVFYYRSAMVQSWNKFCFQGGMFEVRAQLPAALSEESGNPDLKLSKSSPVKNLAYYPTWPGIWMMGNLGRAIFSATTARMWPFSYDRCEPDIMDPRNQRISACDSNPGFGLNPNQGRGAPEIDILEGGGVLISSSLQIGPGMTDEFRLFPRNTTLDTNKNCMYGMGCETLGANYIDVPTKYYANERGHRSWYHGLRYASNNFCDADSKLVQDYAHIAASVKAGIANNTCTVETCPASNDVNCAMDYVDGVSPDHWGINSNGTCHSRINAYMGVFLCDPDCTDSRCEEPRNASTPPAHIMAPFAYQMDAISANWPVHLGAYMDFVTYQLEWVTGANGYVRWMIEGYVIFEVTSDSIINVVQNANSTNPTKIMLEEPMYLIFNVALSKKWAVSPPNPGEACRGDGSDEQTNRICDSFPMYMKVDHVRIYQDMGVDQDADSYMQVGCDPASHPTKEWIEGHLDEYEDVDNPIIVVAGKAFCTEDADCSISGINNVAMSTGACVNSRCVCSKPAFWGGPRCTTSLGEVGTSVSLKQRIYGPPMEMTVVAAGVILIATIVSVWMSMRALDMDILQARLITEKKRKTTPNLSPPWHSLGPSDNYSENFV
ncbi:hypothetical protein BBJ28_00020728 [Nothophytophthora sp. Chile5]|nr:hypothetical protein BBJ28_00020728 [Nothophytophthora sp. Chile5]